MGKTLSLAAILLLSFFHCPAQESEGGSFLDKVSNFPNKMFRKAQDNADRMQKQLEKQITKYLNDLSKKEARLKKKLYAQDPTKAAELYSQDPTLQYSNLIKKLKSDSSSVDNKMGPQYLPYADSLHGALLFFSQNPQLLSNPALGDQASDALKAVGALESKLLIADQIKQYVQQRRAQIGRYLSGEAVPPPGVSGIMSGYDQKIYYYGQQVRQYREMLNDPGRMLSLALTVLDRLPAFASFMGKYSFLASAFGGIPSNYGSPDALVGMQTRDQVLAMIQNQIGSGGGGAASALQSSLQTAQNDISRIQNRVSTMGAGSGNMDLPNFTPQKTKTKSFLHRLEYSTNMQTTHASYYFPTTTDIGLSVGYMINDKNTIGVGASYKIGWGTDFQHIGLSSQGAGLRSFVNINVKKTWYASGGFEYNYQPVPGVDIGNPNSWTKSGLIGASKIVGMNTKVFKKTSISLLWDFLSYGQVPRAQPLVFRVGYSF